MDKKPSPEDLRLNRVLRTQEALRDIGRSDKWRALSSVLADLQLEATRQLYETPADDIASIGRLQGECRVYDTILSQVASAEHDLANTRRAIELRSASLSVVDGLDREPPPGEES